MVHIFHCVSLGLVHLCKGPLEGSLMEGLISKGAYNWDTKKCFERSYSIGAVLIKICFAFTGF